MNGVEVLETLGKFCAKEHCYDCPVTKLGLECSHLSLAQHATEIVALLEKWVKEQQTNTKGAALRQLFPNINKDADGNISICPLRLDDTRECPAHSGEMPCDKCQEKFFSEEVVR